MAKIWESTVIKYNGAEYQAIAPIIISASRATDIPAFYGKWLVDKFNKGFLIKTNPFNGKKTFISLEKVRLVVFWTKNSKPFHNFLSFFEKKGINFYFLFTVNNYPEYELNVPPLDFRIKVFKELSQRIGKEKMLLRYDPLILSDLIDRKDLIRRVKNVINELHPFTTRLIISFVDLKYKKVRQNLNRYNARFKNFTTEDKMLIAKELQELNKVWNLDIRTCAEAEDLSQFGILPNKCIDDELMAKLFPHDKKLMEFIGFSPLVPYQSSKKLKDKGQRKFCNCIYSKDIGQYDTCVQKCIYCYANKNFSVSEKNYKQHKFEDLEIASL